MLPAWSTRILLLATITILSGPSVRSQKSDVIYDELVKLHSTCDGLDTCRGNRDTDNLRSVNCHCDSTCAQLGTCCVDSEYRTSTAGHGTGGFDCHAPLKHEVDAFFMVTRCRRDWQGDPLIRNLCLGDEEEDPLLMVPVSVLRTGITYRNYFCFVCNAADRGSDPPVFWELKLFGGYVNVSRNVFPDLRYDKTSKRWTVLGEIVNPVLEIPGEFHSLANWCRTNVIKTCRENWPYVAARQKCEAYMAVVEIKKEGSPNTKYQNPHCAMCNYEDLVDIECKYRYPYKPDPSITYGYFFLGLFSLEDKVKRCPRNHVFDKFSKKCRAVRCGTRKKMVDGECVDDPRSPRPPQIGSTPKPTRGGSMWLVW